MKLKFISTLLVACMAFYAQAQQVDCNNIPEWSAASIYNTNDQVVFSGNKYTANWWTQGDDPALNSGQWMVWSKNGSCAGSNDLPTAVLTAPSEGSNFVVGDMVTVSANANDTDGTVAKVSFYSNGILIGEDFSAPFEVTWNSNNAGNFALSGVGTDNLGGLSTAATVHVVVSGGSNLLPVVELTSPGNNTSFEVGVPIHFTANASDADGSIAKVQFLADNSVLYETSTSPYAFTWNTASEGVHELRAVAIDNEGATAYSAATITVVGPATSDFSLANLPLQINQNNGTSVAYTFDAPIESVLSRNRGVANFVVNGNSITIQATKAGRTGLKITSSGVSYYMGLRVNKADGSIPGLPQHLSIGSVSEDKAADISFWEDLDTDFTNKEMDIRYIYINGGAIGGWRSWGPDRPRKFAENSVRLGLIPFFVYYNIPDNGESYEGDLAHVRDVHYMTEYFIDINTFMEEVEGVVNGDLYGIILEPDFLGYMQQQSGTNDPTQIATAVNATNISPNVGNIRTLVERINKTIDDKRTLGHNIFYGWQLNLWAYPNAGTGQGVLRITDTKGYDAGREEIKEAAQQTTLFAIASGTLTHGANFLSIDKYGLDAMGHINDVDPSKSRWFFNNDHWNNYLYFVENMHLTSGFPIVLWQLPVGHINGTTTTSAYSGQVFTDLPNTDTKYEDSSSDFFLGDSFVAGSALRQNYFAQNLYNDARIGISGNTITWQDHMAATKAAGVISVLFGAGVNSSTDGVGSPPSDDYFWIQKVQAYYQRGAVPLDKEYGTGNDNPCSNGGCAPVVKILNPQDQSELQKTVLTPIVFEMAAWDLDGTISSMELVTSTGTIVPNGSGGNYSASWLPPSFGTYRIEAKAVDNDGKITIDAIDITVSAFDPALCGVAAWDASVTYANKGTEVSYDGKIFANKWWTQGDLPTNGGVWEYKRNCGSAAVAHQYVPTQYKVETLVYPNPVKNELHFKFSINETGPTTCKVYDVNGQLKLLVFQGILKDGTHSISARVDALEPGIYLYKITSGSRSIHSGRIIKE